MFRIIVVVFLLLVFPSVVDIPCREFSSLIWPQTIMAVGDIEYRMYEPGGEVIKCERNSSEEAEEDSEQYLFS